jgi:hypothetical protein
LIPGEPSNIEGRNTLSIAAAKFFDFSHHTPMSTCHPTDSLAFRLPIAASGHEDRFLPESLNGGCRSSKETSAKNTPRYIRNANSSR